MQQRPCFLWDVEVTEEELRARLRAADPDIRAQWAACIMREARFEDVWKHLSLQDIRRDWPHIRRHLGRARAFWEFLLRGWEDLGLISP